MEYDAEPAPGREGTCEIASDVPVSEVTGWLGDAQSVASYLDRCQVDTPTELVRAIWAHVRKHRTGPIGKALDLGAGDGRFALGGSYGTYVGYEVDGAKCAAAALPAHATLVNACAFSHQARDADVCVGNPPFVRNQDIPTDWRERVHGIVRERTGVTLSGLANAWQYFLLHGLASLKPNGLVALVVPFEWVSRPSAEALRAYICDQGWNVYAYRLRDARFARVLTTASIAVVDKACREGKWEFHEEMDVGVERRMPSPTGSEAGVIGYLRAADLPAETPRAKRGLSPGTQRALVLCESERHRYGLEEGEDVVRCVTSLRHLPEDKQELDSDAFGRHYVDAGRRCWLIRTDAEPGPELDAYLQGVPEAERKTKTCTQRAQWWRFTMPETPSVLFAQGFRSRFPKVVRNTVGARAVGAVCGIYGADEEQISALTGKLDGADLRERVVAYSSGFYKLEINQINALLAKDLAKDVGEGRT